MHWWLWVAGSYGSTTRYKSVERLKAVSNNTLLGATGEISDFQAILQLLDRLMYALLFFYFGVQYFFVFVLNNWTSITVDCINRRVCGPNYVVILRNWILIFESYMARPRVKSRDHKRHGIMRLDCAQNRDTVLGSIVNTVGRAYLIAFRERESSLGPLLTLHLNSN